MHVEVGVGRHPPRPRGDAEVRFVGADRAALALAVLVHALVLGAVLAPPLASINHPHPPRPPASVGHDVDGGCRGAGGDRRRGRGSRIGRDNRRVDAIVGSSVGAEEGRLGEAAVLYHR